MEIKYDAVQALRYELGRLIDTNQGSLTIEHPSSPTMLIFINRFRKKNPLKPITIQRLFDFVTYDLESATITLED